MSCEIDELNWQRSTLRTLGLRKKYLVCDNCKHLYHKQVPRGRNLDRCPECNEASSTQPPKPGRR